MNDIIILLNFIFTSLHCYQIMPGLSTNKQRHRFLLLKAGKHVSPSVFIKVMFGFGSILRG